MSKDKDKEESSNTKDTEQTTGSFVNPAIQNIMDAWTIGLFS